MQTESQIKVNQIAKNLGIILTNAGVQIVRSAYKNFSYISVNFGTIKTNLVNAGIDCPVSELDFSYNTTTWEKWEEALALIHIILGKIKWTQNIYDCDDFARTKKALMALLFGFTDMAEVYGEIYDKDTGISQGLHYFNIIITTDNKVYVHEPITGESVLISKGFPIIIGGWKYKVISVRF